MIPSIKVGPIVGPTGEYDGAVFAIGFERRARYIAEQFQIKAKHKLACGFEDRHVLSYDDNYRWFASNGFLCNELGDSAFPQWSNAKVAEIMKGTEGKIRMCIDASSFSRIRIASLISSMRTAGKVREIDLDIVYCGAEFSPPSDESIPNLSIGPILPEFAGWSVEPDQPPVLVLGLGYEIDKAIGAVEYIEPASIWAFEPSGHDERYTAAIRQANHTLWDVLPLEKCIPYSVYDPYACFVHLESLTFGLLREGRPILVPFGPKVFTVCSLLVNCVHPMASVWRVSSGHLEPPADRIPNGRVTGLNIIMCDTALGG